MSRRKIKLKKRKNAAPFKDLFSKLIRNKKLLITASLAVILLSISIVLIAAYTGKNKGLDVFDLILTVDGEPVIYGEFNHYFNENTNEIYTYFRSKYNAEPNESFWTTSFNGEIPLEKLKELTLEDSVKRKVQQIKGKDFGLVKDISYRGILKDLNKLNEERQKKADNNEVVYGPVKTSEDRYLDEDLNNLRIGLMDKLKGDLQITEKEYLDYYEKNNDQYSLGYASSIKAITMTADNKEDWEKNLEGSKARLEDIKKRIESGVEFEVIYNELLKNKDDILTASEKIYDNSIYRQEIRPEKDSLLSQIRKLEAGQVTGIIEENRSIGMYKCTEKKALGYTPLEDVKDNITKALTIIKFDEFVNEWAKNAEVEILEKNLNRVKIR